MKHWWWIVVFALLGFGLGPTACGRVNRVEASSGGGGGSADSSAGQRGGAGGGSTRAAPSIRIDSPLDGLTLTGFGTIPVAFTVQNFGPGSSYACTWQEPCGRVRARFDDPACNPFPEPEDLLSSSPISAYFGSCVPSTGPHVITLELYADGSPVTDAEGMTISDSVSIKVDCQPGCSQCWCYPDEGVVCLSNEECGVDSTEPLCEVYTGCLPCTDPIFSDSADEWCDLEGAGYVCVRSGVDAGACRPCDPGTTNGCSDGALCNDAYECIGGAGAGGMSGAGGA